MEPDTYGLKTYVNWDEEAGKTRPHEGGCVPSCGRVAMAVSYSTF